MDKSQVEAILCKDGVSCASEHLTGTWSPVYDQSFTVELENGLRFLANFIKIRNLHFDFYQNKVQQHFCLKIVNICSLCFCLSKSFRL